MSLGRLAGEEILITAVEKRESDRYKGRVYLVVHAKLVGDFDADEILITTGAVKVVAKIARLHQLGALPYKCRVFEGQAKESGNRFYDLLPSE